MKSWNIIQRKNYIRKTINILIIIRKITEKTKRSQVIYKTRYLKRILQSSHQKRRRMKDGFSNKIWIIWISDYAVWTDKHASNLPEIDQSCAIWSSEWVCYCIFRWHFDIFKNRRKTWKTCQENSQKTSRKEFLSQIRKIQIS